MLTALAKAFPGNDVEIQRLEMVGPKVGDDLTNKALGALYYATLLIAVYISGRFEQRWMAGVAMAAVLWGGMYLAGLTGLSMGWLVLVALGITLVVCFVLKLNFALGALVGLIHDVFITVGLLSLMGVEIDLNVMAALLTLVGYSLNDTIIVYDRLRENLRAAPKQPLDALINRSVNQTLSRTILTSGTTFVATLALYLLGGGVIHDFALTMLIGVFVGTASSIYVSSAVLLALGARVPVPTLEGQVEMNIPAGSSSGRKFRLRGKGLGSAQHRGDLLARVMIRVPEQLSDEEKALWQQLADKSSFRARD